MTAWEKSLISLYKDHSYHSFQLSFFGMDRERLARMRMEAFKVLRRKVTLGLTGGGEGVHGEESFKGLSGLVRFESLSDFFGIRGFILKDYLVGEEGYFEANKVLLSKLLGAYESEMDFVMVRRSVDDVFGIKALMEGGFYYVSSESVFGKILEGEVYSSRGLGEGMSMGLADERDLGVVCEIARGSHEDNRYFYDDLFDKDAVKEFYGEILRRSHGARDHHVLVCRFRGEVLGFVTVVHNRRLSEALSMGYGSLDYIAVKVGMGRRRIGEALNAYGMEYLHRLGVRHVLVKTLGCNYKAIGLLMKSGFSLTAQNVLLHWRSKDFRGMMGLRGV